MNRKLTDGQMGRLREIAKGHVAFYNDRSMVFNTQTVTYRQAEPLIARGLVENDPQVDFTRVVLTDAGREVLRAGV